MLPDQLCSVCQARLDAVAWSIGRHPGCGPYRPLTDDAYERLVAHLTKSLGATEITAATSGAVTDYRKDDKP